jgi:hypothetical protein
MKYPQFPDVLNASNVQPHNIRFDPVGFASEPETAEPAYSLVVLH